MQKNYKEMEKWINDRPLELISKLRLNRIELEILNRAYGILIYNSYLLDAEEMKEGEKNEKM